MPCESSLSFSRCLPQEGVGFSFISSSKEIFEIEQRNMCTTILRLREKKKFFIMNYFVGPDALEESIGLSFVFMMLAQKNSPIGTCNTSFEEVTQARRTASADWWITPGTAGMRPRDLFTTSRDYRESVGVYVDTKRSSLFIWRKASIILFLKLGGGYIADRPEGRGVGVGGRAVTSSRRRLGNLVCKSNQALAARPFPCTYSLPLGDALV
ncbi:hypothetical protein EVAR_87434_1 [Eumeta japonica]|uniref:Uncharacterized protein n=1 Tax=Eumeta variegata TaxID=151549 RepID=A0A4C1XJ93_EUMVA|nr:hypothetical protein EVAR_87434_1 [Eumeta japonica]